METLNVKTAAPESVSLACKNCDTELHGAYCSECGQKVITARITLWHIFSELVSIMTNLEKGFWYTLKMLFVNPGEVIRNFIAGRTVLYYPPLRYFLLWTAVSVAISLFTGLFDHQQETVQSLTAYSAKPEVAAMQREMQQQIQSEMKKYLNFLPLFMLPFIGLASYWIFRRRGQNYAEHLVLNAYAYGQTTVIGIVLMFFVFAFPSLIPFLTLKVILISIVYYAYLYRSFFYLRTLPAIFKALLTTVLGYAMGMLFFGMIGIIAGIFLYVKMKSH